MFKSNFLLNFLFADNATALRKSTRIIVLGNFVNLEVQELGMMLRDNKPYQDLSKKKVEDCSLFLIAMI